MRWTRKRRHYMLALFGTLAPTHPEASFNLEAVKAAIQKAMAAHPGQ